ncbi:hypothetical protein C8R48DRAFT_714240 [Suillus tomentosus]|nr:hypothetical protein C8R48DRAFT_714240 [Suillus tomentosus]
MIFANSLRLGFGWSFSATTFSAWRAKLPSGAALEVISSSLGPDGWEGPVFEIPDGGTTAEGPPLSCSSESSEGPILSCSLAGFSSLWAHRSLVLSVLDAFGMRM